MQDDTIDYQNGIRFQCQGSGKCCVSRESYGYVYLSKKDLFANSLGILLACLVIQDNIKIDFRH